MLRKHFIGYKPLILFGFLISSCDPLVNEFNDIEEEIVSHERYERLVLEFSQYLHKDLEEKLKQKIISLIKKTFKKQNKYSIYEHNNILEIKNQLYLLVFRNCLKIITFNKYNKDITETDNESQIRIACADRTDDKKSCHTTKYCELSDTCKLYIPRDKYKFFIGVTYCAEP